MMDLKERVRLLPQTSGVYLYKDQQGVVIYVGKANNLKLRVSSYFLKQDKHLKTQLLVEHIHQIDYILTHSEAEALILEASLIKEHQPKYNIQLKDGKTYPFIQITQEQYPLVSLVRINTRKFGQIPKDLYGPYVNPRLIREALIIIRKIFPFRSCVPFADKACLDYHLHLCQAPCEGKISQKDYQYNIDCVRLILEGKKDHLLKSLYTRMEALAAAKDYEEAAVVRDQIRAIGALYAGTKDVNYFKEAEQLMRAVHLPKLPARIECFDISHIMGTHQVGAMVSFFNGQPDKRNYRRFKIKTVAGNDDFASMAEIVYRRYKRLLDEKKLLPDLIVIDGGKGQLTAAMAQLQRLDVSIPIIALAKREEEIFMPGKRQSVRLKEDSLGLLLLRRIRDEAHRFGLTYHRLLRSKGLFKTS